MAKKQNKNSEIPAITDKVGPDDSNLNAPIGPSGILKARLTTETDSDLNIIGIDAENELIEILNSQICPSENPKKSKSSVSDLETARKMLKIWQSAADRKLEFDLSFESVKKLLNYKTCYYTNRVFDEDGIYARSFDRIDSSKGYIENNVVACTVDINGKKSNLTLDEIKCLYEKLIKL